MYKELIKSKGFNEISNAINDSYTDLHTIEIEKILSKEGGEQKLWNLEQALQQCPGVDEKDKREKKACLASLFKPYYELPIENIADVCSRGDNFATIHALATFNVKRMLHIAAPREREDAFASFVEIYNSENGPEKIGALTSIGAKQLIASLPFNNLAKICKKPGFFEYGKEKGGLFNHIAERIFALPYIQNDRTREYRTTAEKLDHICNNISHTIKAISGSDISNSQNVYKQKIA